jgi:hypothetical protein
MVQRCINAVAVELPGVPVRPLLGHMMRSVHRSGAEMQVERLMRGDLLGIGDELDRLVHQVLGQVIPLLRRARRLDLVIVINQLRGPLAGVTAEEPANCSNPRPSGQRSNGPSVPPDITRDRWQLTEQHPRTAR